MGFVKTNLPLALFIACALSSPLAAHAQTICPDRASAEQGLAMDEYYLGKAYADGACGLDADKKQAALWYRKAAEQGHMLAEYELGEVYFTGEGATTDYPEAKKWYLKAAQQGHGEAELRLAFLYAEAHYAGLTVDYTEAEKWFLKAAAQNAGDAQFRLGNFYANYKQPRDYDKAYLWLKRAAQGGDRTAMYDLAHLLQQGKGTPRDDAAALDWMTRAAEADLLQAQMQLSEMYGTGTDAPRDIAKSLKWTVTIAEKPTASVFWLDKAGDIFFEGWETAPKNYPLARRFYERAAEKNDAHAEERLGEMYRDGLGVQKDEVKARAYLGAGK